MTGLLVRLFVKNSGNTTDPEVRRSYGKLAGGVGLVTNLLLSLAKLIFGTTAASIAIIADGINNLTDAASSVVTNRFQACSKTGGQRASIRSRPL